MSAAIDERQDFEQHWLEAYKPEVKKYKRVPLKLAAEVLGHTSTAPVEAMLRSGQYAFGTARRDPSKRDSCYVYEIYPLRFIEWIEGRLS